MGLRPHFSFWLVAMRALSRVLLILCLGTSFTLVGPQGVPTAFAQSSVEKKLQSSLTDAIDDYDILQIQDAEKRLEDAIALAEKEKYTGPVLAKIYVMLGIVRFAATRDEAVTEDAFASALENDYNAVLDPAYATPTLEDLMARAKKRVPPPQTSSSVAEFTHTPVKTAEGGQALVLKAQAPADLKVAKMMALYRRFDEQQFQRIEMKAQGTEYTATIPGSEVRTSQIEYFIFAEDQNGDIVARAGSDQAPFNVTVLGSSNVKTDPVPDPIEPDPETPGASRKYAYVSVFGGTGGGLLLSGSATANPSVVPGVGTAPAFGHTTIEAGGMITESAHLGVFFKFQFAPAQDFSSLNPDPGSGFWDTEEPCFGLGLPGDCMLGLKYKWSFVKTDSLRVYSSFGSGIGRVRNWIQFKQRNVQSCGGKEILSDSESSYCYLRDTVRNGWFHAGAGGGVGIPLTDWLEFTGDLYVMVLLPKTSINADLNAGFTFLF